MSEQKYSELLFMGYCEAHIVYTEILEEDIASPVDFHTMVNEFIQSECERNMLEHGKWRLVLQEGSQVIHENCEEMFTASVMGHVRQAHKTKKNLEIHPARLPE